MGQRYLFGYAEYLGKKDVFYYHGTQLDIDYKTPVCPLYHGKIHNHTICDDTLEAHLIDIAPKRENIFRQSL